MPPPPSKSRVANTPATALPCWEKSEYQRPDPTRPRDTFDKLISLERVHRFTSGLLCSMLQFNKFCIWPVPIPAGACHGTRHVPSERVSKTPHPRILHDGWPDCVQIWCVLKDQLPITFTQVGGEVHLYVRSCTPLFHILQTTGRIAFKFCVWLGIH